MLDFLLTPEPAHDPASFVRRIDLILEQGWPSRVDLAPGALQLPAGWKRDADARLILMLDGAQRHEWRDGKVVHARRLVAGEALWLAAHAPMREDWSEPGHFLGIVLRPRALRFLIGRSRGEGKHPGASPWACAAAVPLAEPGSLIAQALDRLAAGHGDATCAPDLLRILLRFAREHLVRYADGAPSKGLATWQRVQEQVAATCHGEIDRASTARKLGLNPSYLSELCQHHGGKGFVKLVEDIRLERARALLRAEPELAIQRVARQIGFANPAYFSRIFKRATGLSPLQWRCAGTTPPRGT